MSEYRQNYQPEHQPPYISWRSNIHAEKVSFDDAPIYNQAGDLVKDKEGAQFKIAGHEWRCDEWGTNDNGQAVCNKKCNQNFCGQVVISTLLHLFDNNVTAKNVVEDLAPTHPGCEGTGYVELRDFINKNYSQYFLTGYYYNVYASNQLPKFLKEELSLGRLHYEERTLKR